MIDGCVYWGSGCEFYRIYPGLQMNGREREEGKSVTRGKVINK